MNGVCLWCDSPLGIVEKGRHERTTYCSQACAREHIRRGCGPSKRIVEARTAHIKDNPKGAKSVEEYYDMGGRPYTEPHYVRPI